MFRIAAIVEGHGEVDAVPVLLGRIVGTIAPDEQVEIVEPILVSRSKVVKEGELERVLPVAAERVGPDGAVLLLLDADRDCPAVLAATLRRRAEAAAPNLRIRVTLAKSEYEAWFLASAHSLAGRFELSLDFTPPIDPEGVRNAKGRLSAHLPHGRSYRPTKHQAALTRIFDLDAARSAPSFDKLWRDVSFLIQPLD